MDDVRAPRLVLYGLAITGFVMIAMGVSGMSSAEYIRNRRPLLEAQLPGDVWLVLDEARRITEQAAGES
jgi:hypothetical protein